MQLSKKQRVWQYRGNKASTPYKVVTPIIRNESEMKQKHFTTMYGSIVKRFSNGSADSRASRCMHHHDKKINEMFSEMDAPQNYCGPM